MSESSSAAVNPQTMLADLITAFRQMRRELWQAALERKRGERGLNTQECEQVNQRKEQLYIFARSNGIPTERVDELIA